MSELTTTDLWVSLVTLTFLVGPSRLGTVGAESTVANQPDGAIVAKMAAGHRLDFYHDGLYAGSHIGHTRAATFTMPRSTRVYAVKARNFLGSFTGFAGSFSSGELTGTDWKCTNKRQKGWQNPNFDDSSWPAARAIDKLHDIWWRWVTDDINPEAYWIWTESNRDFTVYCRKTREITVHMAADDRLDFYYDGTYVGEPHFAFKTSTDYKIPATTQVYAVRGQNYYKPNAGLVGSFSTGEVTGSDWKCTNKEEAGWTEVGFDDSAWPAAYAIEKLEGGTWPWYPSDINPAAYWIWTKDWNQHAAGDMIVYCRKTRRV